MFDNAATVVFAIFMSLWGTFFLEFWKRQQAAIKFSWNLTNFEEEEEPPRPEYLTKLSNYKYKKRHYVTGVEEPFLPFWRRRFPRYLASFTTMLFLVMIAVSIVVGVIVYRIAVRSALFLRDEELLYNNASLVTSISAACINLFFIFVLNFIYVRVAEKLTDWECLRTQSEYDNSITIKLYTLKFVNYYSSIFYLAFFKGRFVGRPGKYHTLFGARQEECRAGGCLIELVIQLSVIFIGKQFIKNKILKAFWSCLKNWICKRRNAKQHKMIKSRTPWIKDYILKGFGSRQLFNEYLEMLVQYGFVTIFVAAFPLAPMCALLNNILEIRIDAKKYVRRYRRPTAHRTADIGIWFAILTSVSKLAVISNAMIIAFTSGFVDRLVYIYSESPDGKLYGYVNNSLSYFNVSDFHEENIPHDPDGEFNHVEICRYPDYRYPPWAKDKYQYTVYYWHVLCAKFIFVFVFENLIFFATQVTAYLIPDVPKKLQQYIRREAYLTNEIILQTELSIAQAERSASQPEYNESLKRRRLIRRFFTSVDAASDIHPEYNTTEKDKIDESIV